MDIESENSNKSGNRYSQSSSKNSFRPSRGLFALIDQHHSFTPYRSNLELQAIFLSRNSIGSGKSRESRDSDLLNKLAKESSKVSSKSLSRNVSEKKIERKEKKEGESASGEIGSNSGTSERSGGGQGALKIQAHMMAPKIHNCVCFAAGECLNYNCNCFLSPFPCAPECCPNCLTLKSNLPHKVTNMCSCKKTKCLKLYCQCLSKGVYCGVMCRCELCQNHQNSTKVRQLALNNGTTYPGCSCQKSKCINKYCDCFSRNLKCTPRCGCFDCHNMLKTEPPTQKRQKYEEMDLEQPEMEFEAIDFFGANKK